MVQIRIRREVLVLIVAVCVDFVHSRPNYQINDDHLNLISTTNSIVSGAQSRGDTAIVDDKKPLLDVKDNEGQIELSSNVIAEALDVQPATRGLDDEDLNVDDGGDKASESPPLVAEDKEDDEGASRSCCCGDYLVKANDKLVGDGNLGGKLDLFDYVVSDLEFAIVLKRLRSECDEQLVKQATADASERQDEDEIQDNSLDKSNSFPELKPSECYICLTDFEQNYAAATTGDSNEHNSDNNDDKRGTDERLKASDPTMTTQDTIVHLLCGHKFHLPCIKAWYLAGMAQSHRCPICQVIMRLSDGTHLNKLL